MMMKFSSSKKNKKKKTKITEYSKSREKNKRVNVGHTLHSDEHTYKAQLFLVRYKTNQLIVNSNNSYTFNNNFFNPSFFYSYHIL